MSANVFEHIVVGAGGMGSAALHALAERGKRVLGLEQFSIPHELGSYAGSTRIFRFAYFEHPSYVPLMRLSFDRWRAVERDFGEGLLTITGGLDIGLPAGRVITGAKAACAEHKLAHEVLSARELARRHPAWQVPGDFEAVFQPDAGFLPADRAVVAHATLARKLGAEIRENETVQSWKATGSHVEVVTDRGRYEAGSLVITAGAWTSRLVSRFRPLAIPERQVVGWFKTQGMAFAPASFPVFILDCPDAGTFYGFPDRGEEGFKIGRFHHRHENVEPDTIDRRIVPEDVHALKQVEPYLSAPMGDPLGFKTCMFVNSPDEHFIIDVLPEHRNVAIAAGFSGHGFKFCSGVGEILADLATEGRTRHDASLFRLSRGALQVPAAST